MWRQESDKLRAARHDELIFFGMFILTTMAAGTTRQVELTATRWCGGWLVLLELAQQFPIYTAAKLSFFLSCPLQYEAESEERLEARGCFPRYRVYRPKGGDPSFLKKVSFLSGKLSGIR